MIQTSTLDFGERSYLIQKYPIGFRIDPKNIFAHGKDFGGNFDVLGMIATNKALHTIYLYELPYEGTTILFANVISVDDFFSLEPNAAYICVEDTDVGKGLLMRIKLIYG